MHERITQQKTVERYKLKFEAIYIHTCIALYVYYLFTLNVYREVNNRT